MTNPLHDKTMAAFEAWLHQIGQTKGLGKKPPAKTAALLKKPAASVPTPPCPVTKMGEYNVLRCAGGMGHKGPHNFYVADKDKK